MRLSRSSNWMTASASCRRLFRQLERRDDSRAFCTAGNKRATSVPMIAITTSSSTSVKPRTRSGRILSSSGLKGRWNYDAAPCSRRSRRMVRQFIRVGGWRLFPAPWEKCRSRRLATRSAAARLSPLGRRMMKWAAKFAYDSHLTFRSCPVVRAQPVRLPGVEPAVGRDFGRRESQSGQSLQFRLHLLPGRPPQPERDAVRRDRRAAGSSCARR